MRASRTTGVVFAAVSLAATAGIAYLLIFSHENQPHERGPEDGASPAVDAGGSPAHVEREPGPESTPASPDAPERRGVGASVEPGISDIRPAEVYEAYAYAVLEGDLDAMAIQASVLRFCRDTAISGYPEAIKDSSLSEREKESELLRFERCRPLVELVGDIEAAYSRLRRSLYESEHPLILVAQGGVDADTKRLRLLAVLMNDYSEPQVYERTFMEAANYHLAYAQHRNELRREAWTILSCEASWNCDSSEYRQNIRTKFYQDHLYEQILEIEDQIRTAIREKNSEGLGF